MEKYQVQFIVGPFTVNHLAEGNSPEDVKTKFFTTFKNKKASGELWEIEDSLLDPASISMVRIMNFQDQQETEEDCVDCECD